MVVRLRRVGRQEKGNAFTLAEVLTAIVILALLMGGMAYAYLQANRMAEWSAMSLAAQSYAAQGLEQVRAAQWNFEQWPPTNSGPGTGDELKPPQTITQTNDPLDIPTTGQPINATNIITITDISFNNCPLRQVRSDCIWTFPQTGRLYTNTMITYRAPDL
jgi:prepilin-type N-terminal cleavage/methylation domain-containing protein